MNPPNAALPLIVKPCHDVPSHVPSLAAHHVRFPSATLRNYVIVAACISESCQRSVSPCMDAYGEEQRKVANQARPSNNVYRTRPIQRCLSLRASRTSSVSSGSFDLDVGFCSRLRFCPGRPSSLEFVQYFCSERPWWLEYESNG